MLHTNSEKGKKRNIIVKLRPKQLIVSTFPGLLILMALPMLWLFLVLVGIPFAMIKYHDQKQAREVKIYLTYPSILLFIIERSQDKD